jgi:hypothetical protein
MLCHSFWSIRSGTAKWVDICVPFSVLLLGGHWVTDTVGTQKLIFRGINMRRLFFEADDCHHHRPNLLLQGQALTPGMAPCPGRPLSLLNLTLQTAQKHFSGADIFWIQFAFPAHHLPASALCTGLGNTCSLLYLAMENRRVTAWWSWSHHASLAQK